MKKHIQLKIFNPEKYGARKSSNQIDFEETLKNYLPIFGSIILGAFDKMKIEQSTLHPFTIGRNWYAERMHFYIREGLLEHGLNQYAKLKNGALSLAIEGYSIRLKKLKWNYMPDYVSTVSSMANIYGKVEKGADDVSPIVYIGYRVDQNWLMLEGVYAVSTLNDKSYSWVSDKYLNPQVLVASDDFDSTPEDIEVEITLKKSLKEKKAN